MRQKYQNLNYEAIFAPPLKNIKSGKTIQNKQNCDCNITTNLHQYVLCLHSNEFVHSDIKVITFNERGNEDLSLI